jgi:serine/threonine protein kinase/formylglycine-generating enzyme required for sulfatase activity/Leucine-rich repeat (LRR) protein
MAVASANAANSGTNVKQFLELAESTGVLAPDVIATLKSQWPEARRGEDAGGLARELAQQGKLTKYQAAGLYQGKPKGLVLGKYLLLDRLGAGGLGTVFKGQHRQTGQIVAIKVLSPAATRSPDSVRRFQREAEAASRLNHPNIVRALETGEVDGQHFMVMDYVEGVDLSNYVKKQGPLPLEQAVGCTVQVARALAYAHEQGVIHRDIKPGNLMLGRDGQIKILDMGLARLNDPATAGTSQAAEGLTQTGQVMGTVDYMAPEQALHTRLADARADVYSLGCTFYRLMTGKIPYEADSLVMKILAHREKPIPSLRASIPTVPVATDLVLQRMLAKKPEDRHQTMTELADDLERSLSGAAAPIALVAKRLPAAELSAVIDANSSSSISLSPLTNKPVSTTLSPSQTTSPLTAVPAASGKRGVPVWAYAAAALLLVGAGVAFVALRGKPETEVAVGTATENPSAPEVDAASTVPTNPVAPTTDTPATVPSTTEPPAVDPKPIVAKNPVMTNSSTPPTATPELAAPAAATSDAADDRELAKWVLERDLNIYVYDTTVGQSRRITSVAELPAGPICLMAVMTKRSGQLRDDDLLKLAEGREISALVLHGPTITDGAISQMSSFPLLKTLILIDAAITDAGLAGLRKIKGLTQLSLYNTQVTDAGLDTVAELPNLTYVNLNRLSITDAGIAKLRGLAQLRFLNLGLTKVTDQSVPFITSLPALEKLAIKGSQITDVGRQQVAASLPKCQIDPQVGPAMDLVTPERFKRSVIVAPSSPAATGSPPSAAAPPLAVAPFDDKQARAHQEAWAAYLGNPVESTNSLGMKLILIPPGEFLMGSTPEQVEIARQMAGASPVSYYFERLPEEMPQHRVVISQPFLMGSTEVTIGQYRKFVEATNYVTETEKYGFGNSGETAIAMARESDKGRNWRSPGYGVTDDSPVSQLTWSDAVAYCAWLSQQEQRTPWYRANGNGGWLLDAQANGYRLPTEAEWEYACRAGTTTQFWFGDDKSQIERHAWTVTSSGNKAQSVGLKGANPFGLFDMHGNIYEWCHDWHDPKWYERTPSVDPLGPPSGTERTSRGGGWASGVALCRTAFRNYNVPSYRGRIGIRVVRSVSAASAAPPMLASNTPAAPPPASPPNQPAGQPAQERLDVPDAKAIDEALKLVRGDLFADGYAKAKKPDERAALARTLQEYAAKLNDDPVSRFVILREARDLAAEGGDITLAATICFVAETQYQVDDLIWLAEACDAAQKRSLPSAVNKSIAGALLTKVEEALQAEEFDAAERLLNAALAIARKSQDQPTIKAVVDRDKQFDKDKQQRVALTKARETLAEKPDDLAANLIVGKQLCFVEEKWAEGLACLAKSNDAALKDLAEKSLPVPTGSDELVALADQWWVKAEKASGQSKRELMFGALHWYEQAADKVSGLAKTKVDKRIADARAAAGPKTGGASAPRTVAVKPAPISPPAMGGGVDVRGLQTPGPQAYAQFADWVFQRGGRVNIRYNSIGGGSTITSASRTANLPTVPYQITGVTFSSSDRCTDADLATIGAIPWITSVSVTSQPITDAGFVALANLPALSNLYIRSPKQLTSAGLANLARMTSLQTLALENVGLSGKSLTQIAGLKSITRLELTGNPIGDSDLSTLASMRQLSSLFLDGTRVTDAGLVQLRGLTSLSYIKLGDSQITDAGLVNLQGMSNLQILDLTGSRVTGRGLSALETLPITSLMLDRTPISDATLDAVLRFPRIGSLHLQNTGVTDAGLAKLAGHPTISFLNLTSSPISDASLATFAKMPKLRTVFAGGTRITRAAAQAFKAQTSINVVN